MSPDVMSKIRIGPAAAADTAAIAALLRAAGLPHDDFAQYLAHFIVARDPADAVIGAIGAEVGGSDALLRSLVVAPGARGTGLGGRLVDALDQAAAGWGVRSWWLLTTTAEGFFLQRGFRPAPRASAPPAILATREFRELCPAVAACLSRARKAEA